MDGMTGRWIGPPGLRIASRTVDDVNNIENRARSQDLYPTIWLIMASELRMCSTLDIAIALASPTYVKSAAVLRKAR